ncbi:hypothetical protein EVAR_64349_1 [Eumeta japonica]|uniref:Uncharacterized protein n=1 Tax=Eumeta variegata TaxID=151549 RepID=A0A4C1ZPU6_EUMVA|nr:hypothetical protein EVAR_64349_1 [Eumeta japonica]
MCHFHSSYWNRDDRVAHFRGQWHVTAPPSPDDAARRRSASVRPAVTAEPAHLPKQRRPRTHLRRASAERANCDTSRTKTDDSAQVINRSPGIARCGGPERRCAAIRAVEFHSSGITLAAWRARGRLAVRRARARALPPAGWGSKGIDAAEIGET